MFEYNDFGGGFGAAMPEPKMIDGLYIPQESECRSCGICVGNCPTYQLSGDSVHSPRGRIRLIERILEDGETLEANEVDSLQACLQCRACESHCPSKMPYAQLLNKALEKLAKQDHPQFKHSLAIRLLKDHVSTHAGLRNTLFSLSRAYQKSGAQNLLGRLPLPAAIKDANALLNRPLSSEKLQEFYPASQKIPDKSVALFSSCLASEMDRQTHHSAIAMLNVLGYDVKIPQAQSCCGALQDHHGDKGAAKRLAITNMDAFMGLKVPFIVHTASGCGSFLREYDQLQEGDRAQHFTAKLVEIMELIANSERLPQLRFKPLAARVLVHEPCTLPHASANPAAVYTLLGKIPELQVEALDNNQRCCGAGGTHLFSHPELAKQLRDEKLQAEGLEKTHYLVSSNMSCALHLAAGLRERGLEIELIHPVQLLQRQLDTDVTSF